MKYIHENIAFDGHLNALGLIIFGLSWSTLKIESPLIAIIVLFGTLMMLMAQKHPHLKKRKSRKAAPKSFPEKIKSIAKFVRALFIYKEDMIIHGEIRKARPFIFGYLAFITAYIYHVSKLFDLF